jgi:uncharacterized SAM-binding protein YcdF (DUF218 family)
VGPRRSLLSKTLFVLIVLLIVGIATHSLWMRTLGALLIRDEAPEHADMAVVLAGDQNGVRIGKATELIKAGYAPAALVSGPPYFDMHECDAAIAYMIHKGYPAQWFIPFPNTTTSTNDEAQAILAELRRRGVHRFLLVTSSYHTARATRIYRATIKTEGGGFEFRTVAAPDPYFPPSEWWRTREGKKTFFIEWCKTIATGLGV